MGVDAIGTLIAFVAGVSFVFQQAVNSNLRVEIGSPWWAGFASYLGGDDHHVNCCGHFARAVPKCCDHGKIAWNVLDGRAVRSCLHRYSILLLPRLGAAAVIALIVAGQMYERVPVIASD